MKSIKKFLSVLLSLCLLTAFLPAVAFADNEKIYAVYNSADHSLSFCVGRLNAAGTAVERAGGETQGEEFYTDFADVLFCEPSGDTEPDAEHPLCPWLDHAADVQTVRFLDEIAPTYTAVWFYGFTNLENFIDLEKLNTANVLSMFGMFAMCESLTSLDVSHFDTAQVRDMSAMFGMCQSLTSLDLSGFNTAQVRNMENMFAMCQSLTDLDVSDFDTRNVESMFNMFIYCPALTSLDLSSFRTDSLTMTEAMFCMCTNLRWLDMSNFNSENFREISGMFYSCSKLTYLLLGPDFRFYAEYIDKDELQRDYPGLPDPPATSPNTGKWIHAGDETGTTYTTREMMDAYDGSAVMTGLWLWEGSPLPRMLSDATVTVENQPYTGEALRPSVTVTLNGAELIEGINYTVKYKNNTEIGTATVIVRGKGLCFGKTTQTFAITAPPVEQYAVWDNAAKTLTLCAGTLSGNTVTRTGDGEPHTVTGTEVSRVDSNFYVKLSTRKVIFLDPIETASSASSMFANCSALTEIQGLAHLTARGTSLRGMFNNCSSLTTLDLSGFNTANTTNMDYMFYGCSSLTSLNLSDLNTANVTDMTGMFFGCSSLTSLDLRSFNTAGVTGMGGMFYGCSALTNVLFGDGFSTANVTDIGSMFLGCASLTSLDLSNWNTANVELMGGMFASCAGLTSLDLSNFNTEKVTTMLGMFGACTSLPTLDVSSFVVGENTVTDGMFYGDTALASLKLGTGFRFNDGHAEANDPAQLQFVNACLPDAPADAAHTGKWIRATGGTAYTAEALMENFSGATMAGTWEWELRVDLSGATVTVEDPTYTGEPLEPAVTVTLGETTLTRDTDYTAAYDNNTNIGPASVTVTGIGAYTGTVTKYFSIKAPTVDISGATVTVADQTYTGTALRPTVTVKLDEATTLTEGTDYYVTYENNIEIGTASVTATGIGAYSGTVTKTFAITAPTPAEPEVFAVFSGPHTENPTLTFCVGTRGNDCVIRSLNGEAVYGETFYTGFINTSEVPWDGNAVKIVRFLDEIHPVSTAHWFERFYSLQKIIGIENLKTEKVTSMEYMFHRCTSLQVLDLTHFDTREVTTMAYMFLECYSLTSLDLSSFNTKKVTDMSGMFEFDKYDSSLVSLDVSSFDTGSVTNMNDMFSGCDKLTALDVSGFDTRNVEEMNSMFFCCRSLTALDVSHFDTTNVVDMDSMFSRCGALTSLDLSGFDIRNLQRMHGSVGSMLEDCCSLSSIKLGPNFRFWSEAEEKGEIETVYADLPDVPTVDPYTGRWIRVSGSAPYSSRALMVGYDGRDTMVGTWIWEGSPFPADISGATVTVEDQVYTGEALTPPVTVTLGETTLTEDTDYTVAYANNTKVGTARVTVTGIGGYRGTVTKTFAITAYVPDIADAAVTVEDQTYTGKALRPAVTVTLGDTALTEGTDFFVTYTNNINVGTATVTVTGIGGYRGTATKTFAITAPAIDLSGAAVAVADQTYTGKALRPAVTVTLDDTALTEGTDYFVTYTDNTEIGTATVKVTGIGAYAGTVTQTFAITAPIEDLSNAFIFASDQVYTGKALRPAVTVKLNGKTLTEGTDYYVIYANNTDVGTATVTAFGIGKYPGSATGTFAITAHTSHTWDAGKVTKAATCREAGMKTFTCTVCGDIKTEPIAKTTDHTWDAGKVTKAATCREAGVKTFSCTVCGDTRTESIAKTSDHTWDAGKVTKAATCKETGERTFTCTVCGDTKTEVLAKTTDHTWDAGKVTKAATCKEAGVKTFTCTVCGATKTEPIAKTTDHTWDAGKVTKAAACTADGVKTYTCTVCRTTRTEKIPAVNHKWGAWTKLNDTQHSRTCANDGSHTEKADHAWDAGKVTKEATAEAAGEKTYTCTVCGGTKTETIPQKPAENPVIPGDVDGNGRVDAADARYALRAAVGLDDTAEGLDFSSETNRCFLAADVTKDGKILAEDARLILRAAVGLETLA